MSIEKVVRIFAGAVVLVSLALAVMVNLNWLWLTAFVGANLFQSGFTGICPLESILKNAVVQVVCPSCLTANRVPGERLGESPAAASATRRCSPASRSRSTTRASTR